MEREEFERLVAEALEDVPEFFKEKLDNIDIVIEDKPSRGLLRRLRIPTGGTLFGLYQGVPMRERGLHYGGVLPDKITLFKEPLEGSCRSSKALRERVRHTVLHELAHYFGISDERLKELGVY
ncbi:MAG: metallopeptidase family protein [Nitrospinota bacterium]